MGGEEVEVMVRVGDADRGNAVVLLHGRPLAPLAAAPLERVALQVLPLQEPILRQGDHDVALRDQVLVGRLLIVVDNLRAAVVAKLLAQLLQFVVDDAVQHPVVAEDAVVGCDVRQKLFQFLVQFLALKAGEALKAHLQNGLGLGLGEAQLRDQPLLGLLSGLGGADELNDLLDDVKGLHQPFDDMFAGLGLTKAELRPAAHHLAAVVQEEAQQPRNGQHAGVLVVQRQVDDAKGGLELRAAIELAHHQLRVRVTRQVQHDAHPVAVRLVPDIRDAVDLLVLHGQHHRLDERGLVHRVGDLRDDDAGAAAFALLDVHPPPEDDLAPARAVSVIDSLTAQDQAARGEVRSRQTRHDVRQAGFFRRGLRLEQPAEDVHHLPQVVRGDVRRHADGDARAAVDQQVRQHRRQGQRLLQGLVEVGAPLHRVLVDIGQHQLAQRVEPGLGVAHGRRAVPVHGAEVALPVHQAVTQVPVLGQTHHCVVDGGVAVGVVLTHRLTDDTGGFFIGRVVAQAQLGHGVQNAALDGLQPIPRVRQSPADDDAHRVVQVTVLDLAHEGQGDDSSSRQLLHALRRGFC